MRRADCSGTRKDLFLVQEQEVWKLGEGLVGAKIQVVEIGASKEKLSDV